MKRLCNTVSTRSTIRSRAFFKCQKHKCVYYERNKITKCTLFKNFKNNLADIFLYSPKYSRRLLQQLSILDKCIPNLYWHIIGLLWYNVFKLQCVLGRLFWLKKTTLYALGLWHNYVTVPEIAGSHYIFPINKV